MWKLVEKDPPRESGSYIVLGKSGQPYVAHLYDGGTWSRRTPLYWAELPPRPAPLPEYMDDYLNRNNNDLAVLLMGITGAMDNIIGSGARVRNDRNVQPLLRQIQEDGLAALEALTVNLDMDQKKRIDRQADNIALRILPKTAPVCSKVLQFVDGDALVDIANIARENECAICMKNEREARNCEFKKKLIACGLVTNSPTQAICPYMDTADMFQQV